MGIPEFRQRYSYQTPVSWPGSPYSSVRWTSPRDSYPSRQPCPSIEAYDCRAWSVARFFCAWSIAATILAISTSVPGAAPGVEV